MNPFAPFHAVRRYIGKMRTIHEEIRTVRYLNSLPGQVRKDIGWPDLADYRGMPGRRHPS